MQEAIDAHRSPVRACQLRDRGVQESRAEQSNKLQREPLDKPRRDLQRNPGEHHPGLDCAVPEALQLGVPEDSDGPGPAPEALVPARCLAS